DISAFKAWYSLLSSLFHSLEDDEQNCIQQVLPESIYLSKRLCCEKGSQTAERIGSLEFQGQWPILRGRKRDKERLS
nr:hypothetical protein [Tanacetum cinerariifolium]